MTNEVAGAAATSTRTPGQADPLSTSAAAPVAQLIAAAREGREETAMKNGSVQRAAKRSYMDEATLSSVMVAVAELREEIGLVKRQIDETTAALGAVTELVAGLDRSLRGTVNLLGERVATLESTVASLAAIDGSMVISEADDVLAPNADAIPDADLTAAEVA